MSGYKFKPEKLPYDFDALAGAADRETLETHWKLHYCKYINDLNVLLSGYPRFWELAPEQLASVPLNAFPEGIGEKIRFSAGGAFAHELYFQGLRPFQARGTADCENQIVREIRKKYATVSDFIYEMCEAAVSISGSGFVWIVRGRNGNIFIEPLENNDVPNIARCRPLFALDVWEHSYYLQYRNNRRSYLERIAGLIDFDSMICRLNG